MSLAVLTLPINPLPNFSFEPKDDLIRDDMDGGYASSRPRNTRMLYKLSGVTYQLTTEQLHDFMIFHDQTLVNGSLPFSYELKVLAAESGEFFSFGELTFTFTSSPKYKYTGLGVWEVTLEMEML